MGMRLRPAGTEIRAPTPGTRWPISTAFPPCRSNTSLALSTSDVNRSPNRSNRLISLRRRSPPIRSPKVYRISEVVTLAAVAVSSTGMNERRPCPTKKPASGRVSSVGIGRCKSPNTISTNTPTYPKEWTTSVTHLARSVSSSPTALHLPTSSEGHVQYAPYDARTAAAVGEHGRAQQLFQGSGCGGKGSDGSTDPAHRLPFPSSTNYGYSRLR